MCLLPEGIYSRDLFFCDIFKVAKFAKIRSSGKLSRLRYVAGRTHILKKCPCIYFRTERSERGPCRLVDNVLLPHVLSTL